MAQLMKFVALTAVLCCFLPTMITADSKWGEEQYCPDGEVALGFGMRKGNRGFNSIALTCSGGSRIYSNQGGPSGKWRQHSRCPGTSVIAQCQLKIFNDEFVNNMNCICVNDAMAQLLEGDGFFNGELGEWADVCVKGYAGLKTRVQDEEAEEDNTIITDVEFLCRDS